MTTPHPTPVLLTARSGRLCAWHGRTRLVFRPRWTHRPAYAPTPPPRYRPLSRLHRTWGAQLTWRRWPAGDSASSERGSPTAAGARARPRDLGDVPLLLPSVSQARRARRLGERPFLDVAAHRRSRVATAGSGCSSASRLLGRGDRWLRLRAIAADLAGEGNQLAAIAKLSARRVVRRASLVGLWVGFFAGPWLASRVRGTRQFVFDLGLRFRPIDAVGIVIGWAARSSSGSCTCPSAATSTTSTARRPS